MQTQIFKFILGFLLSLSFLETSFADEGMWTFDKFPSKVVKQKYGVDINKEWLNKTQLSSVRLTNGCSGSFISEKGLILTNHHCVDGCVQQLSTAKNDYIKNGFLAKDEKAELTCPALEINRLIEISDVTNKVKKATANLKGEALNKARKTTIAELEKTCSQNQANTRCDVISLYRGGLYHIYKYQRYPEVKLVFAPEHSAAAFGGDPDNFNFPRYSLDFAFLRVYENGKPLQNEHYFNWAKEPIKEKDVTFVTGHPGNTSRLLTISQFEYLRDSALIKRIILMSEMRGLLTEYQKRGKEQKRTAHARLQGIENGLKVFKGQLNALTDKNFFNSLVKKEKDFRSKVASRPQLRQQYGKAWDEIAKLVKAEADMSNDINFIIYNNFGSRLFGIAQTLVRAPEELKKPEGDRFEEFRDSKLPQLKQQLFSPAPVYKELEIALMDFMLSKTREALSPDHPFVKKILGHKSTEQVAKELIQKSKLHDPKLREKLFNGGLEAINNSSDPMIQFVKNIDPEIRAKRKYYEDNIDSALQAESEKIAAAQFAVYGTDHYPDATFSLRISYGQVLGYEEDGKYLTPMTTMKNTFLRNTGSDPFALPSTWLKAKNEISPKAAFNFISTNDIIGGNSGSPILNKNAEIIGVVFDGNIHSLGGSFGFDPAKNRAVSVQSEAMLESLKTIYKAERLLKEIKR